MKDAAQGGFGPVPLYLRDAHYPGYERPAPGAQKEYLYPHDYPGHWTPQAYMPPEAEGHRYYIPSDQGAEAKFIEQHRRRGKG
jgi:putative ATPase